MDFACVPQTQKTRLRFCVGGFGSFSRCPVYFSPEESADTLVT